MILRPENPKVETVKPIPKSPRAEKSTLAKRSNNRPAGDEKVLIGMGLRALIVEGDGVEPTEVVTGPKVGDRRGRAFTPEMKRRSRETQRRKYPIGFRKLDRMLLLMEPGKAYVADDLVAPSGLGRNAAKAWVRVKLRQMGLVERVQAPAGMKHSGPLLHGSPHKDPVRWLWRLTERGIAERQAAADARAEKEAA